MSNRLRGSKVMRQGGVDTLITEEPDDRIGHVRICGGDGSVMTVSVFSNPEMSLKGGCIKPLS